MKVTVEDILKIRPGRTKTFILESPNECHSAKSLVGYKDMEKEVEKKPIGPTLKRMQVGDKEAFPVWRALSVRSTIGQIQTVTDMRFSTRSEYPDFIVTRKQ